MQQINPLISLLTAFLVLFLAAVPPVALFLSFELLLAQLKQTAVRLEAQNSLDEIVREIREKESEFDGIVRNRTETIKKLEGEIGRLTEKTNQWKTDIKNYSNGKTALKPSKSDTIGRDRQQRTSKKQEAMQQLLEVIRTKPNPTLSELAVEIGRSKSTVGGYLPELQADRLIEKDEFGWTVLKDILLQCAE